MRRRQDRPLNERCHSSIEGCPESRGEDLDLSPGHPGHARRRVHADVADVRPRAPRYVLEHPVVGCAAVEFVEAGPTGRRWSRVRRRDASSHHSESAPRRGESFRSQPGRRGRSRSTARDSSWPPAVRHQAVDRIGGGPSTEAEAVTGFPSARFPAPGTGSQFQPVDRGLAKFGIERTFLMHERRAGSLRPRELSCTAPM